MVLADIFLLSCCVLLFFVGVHLHKKLHESIEQRIDSLLSRLCSLESLPKAEPIVPPAPAAEIPAPKKRRSPRAKKE